MIEKRNYQDLYDALEHCEVDSDEEFELYKEMVVICEDSIKTSKTTLKMMVHVDLFPWNSIIMPLQWITSQESI